MQEIWIDYLNALDAKALALTNDEILAAVRKRCDAQGRGETVIEPRVHLVPESSDKGHFNVLRGYVKALNYAGVKVVGDFVDNYKRRSALRDGGPQPVRSRTPACRRPSSTRLLSPTCAPAP